VGDSKGCRPLEPFQAISRRPATVNRLMAFPFANPQLRTVKKNNDTFNTFYRLLFVLFADTFIVSACQAFWELKP
jgi:hypothetical protein